MLNQFSRFLFILAVAAVVYAVLAWVVLELSRAMISDEWSAGMRLAVNVTALSLVAAGMYPCLRHWVFAPRARRSGSVGRYVLAALGVAIGHECILTLLLLLLPLSYPVILATALVMSTLTAFLVYQRYVF